MFRRNCLFSKQVVPFYTLAVNIQQWQLLCFPADGWYCQHFNFSHSKVVIFYWGFNLHFLKFLSDTNIARIFSQSVAYLLMFFSIFYEKFQILMILIYESFLTVSTFCVHRNLYLPHVLKILCNVPFLEASHLAFTFKSVIHLKLILYTVLGKSYLHFFPFVDTKVFPQHLLRGISFFHGIVLAFCCK